MYCKVSIKVSSDLSYWIFSTGRSGYLDYLKIMTSVKAGHLATGIGCNSGQSSLLGWPESGPKFGVQRVIFD